LSAVLYRPGAQVSLRNAHKYCKYIGSVDERLAAYDMARFLLSHGSTPEGALASMLAAAAGLS